MSYHCEYCKEKQKIEESITDEIISELYDTLIKEIAFYNDVDEYDNLEYFINYIKQYKQMNYYKNKNILKNMLKITCNMFTDEERTYILNNNKCISDALIINAKLIEYVECGYGISSSST